MKKLKTSLVLEGGGLRGAYTAGALAWLIDNNIEFDSAYGISVGAVHLCNYLLKNKKDLLDFSTSYISDKNAIGVRAIIRCGHIVDYEYLFNNLMIKVAKFDMSALKKIKCNGKIGTYELNTGKAEYHPIQNIELEELRATCTLPLLGRIAKLGDRKMLDAGISDMIPIEQSIKEGNNKHLIITTKPGDYVRKPSNKFVVFVMKLRYLKCPNIAKDYNVRHLNYYKQISMIEDVVNKGDGLYIYPSRTSNVTRLGGSHEDLVDLFNLGYADMENKKQEILALVENV